MTYLDLLLFLRYMKIRAWEINSDSDFILSEKMIICPGHKVIKPNSKKVCVGPELQSHLCMKIISGVKIRITVIQEKLTEGG